MIVAKFVQVLTSLALSFGYAVSTNLIKDLPAGLALPDDVVVYRITEYFRGTNTSMEFKSSDDNILQPIPSYINQAIKFNIGANCGVFQKAKNKALDIIFGLCDGGKKVISFVFNPSTETVLSQVSTKTLTQICYDMKLDTKAKGLFLSCKEGDAKSAEVILELSISDLSQVGIMKINRNTNELAINLPLLEMDQNPGSNTISMIMYEGNPGKQTGPSFRWIYRKDKSGLSEGNYFDLEDDDIPPYLGFSVLRNIFLSGGNLTIFFSQNKPKMTKCYPIDTKLYCSDPQDVMESLGEEYKTFFEYVNQTRFNFLYLTEEKLIRKIFEYPSLKPVAALQTVYFDNDKLFDLKKPLFARSIGNEICVVGTQKGRDNSVILYWNQDTSYVSTETKSGISVAAMHVHYSHADSKKLEVLYFDSLAKTFDVFRLGDFKFKIAANNAIFKGEKNVSLDFQVSDFGSSNKYSIFFQVWESLFGYYRIKTKAELYMYVGTSAALPISSDSFNGNAPTFEVVEVTSPAQVKLKYAEVVQASLPSIDTSETILKTGLNIGDDHFLIASNTQWNLFKCLYVEDIDKVSCFIIFSLNSTERILDAKLHMPLIYVLTATNPTSEGGEVKIGLHNLIYDQKGEMYSDPIYYGLDTKEAIGVLRTINRKVYVDVIVQNFTSKEWSMFSTEFLVESAFPEALTKLSVLPPNICPKIVTWSSRKEPYIFIESLCDGGRKEVIEFEVDYSKFSEMKQIKTYVLDTQGKTGICLTGPLMIVIDYSGRKVFGIDRNTGHDSRLSFPLADLKVDTIVSHTCPRFNNYFQLIATDTSKASSKQNYLITYRTNTEEEAGKRVHSILPINSVDPLIGIPSIGSYSEQQIFTIVLNQDGGNLNNPDSFLIQLDTLSVKLDASKISAEGEVKAKIRVKPDPRLSTTGSVDSEVTVKIATQDTNVTFVNLQGTNNTDKVKVKRSDKVFYLDDYFFLKGVTFDQVLEAPQAVTDKIEVIKRVEPKPELTKNIQEAFLGSRIVENIIIGWNSKSIFIYQDGKKNMTIPGVSVQNAEIFAGDYQLFDNDLHYVFMMGLSRRTYSGEPMMFVIYRNLKGNWSYADTPAPEGTNYVEVFLLDAAKKSFFYLNSNAEQDYFLVGQFSLVFNPVVENYEIKVESRRIIKRFDQKIDQVQALYIAKIVRIIYTPRNTPYLNSMSVDPISFEVLADVPIAVGNDMSESFSESLIQCSEYYSPYKIVKDATNDQDLRFYCVITSSTYLIEGHSLKFMSDPRRPPKIERTDRFNNIIGFHPVSLRVENGYTAIVYKITKDFDQSKGIASLANDSVVFMVWKNGDARVHSLIPLSSIGYGHYNKELFVRQYYNVDFLQVSQTTAKMAISCSMEPYTTKILELNPLGFNIKDHEVDLAPLKLRVVGLTEEQIFDVGSQLDYRPRMSVYMIMICVAGALLLMIVCAGVYQCVASGGSKAKKIDPEIIALPDATNLELPPSPRRSPKRASPTKNDTSRDVSVNSSVGDSYTRL
jgi:hypothetical protein